VEPWVVIEFCLITTCFGVLGSYFLERRQVIAFIKGENLIEERKKLIHILNALPQAIMITSAEADAPSAKNSPS
jgi:hypothetical protein